MAVELIKPAKVKEWLEEQKPVFGTEINIEPINIIMETPYCLCERKTPVFYTLQGDK